MTARDENRVVDRTLGKPPSLHDTYYGYVPLKPNGWMAIISFIATAVYYLAAGPSLGLFIGGFFVVTLLAPAASLLLNRLKSGLGEVSLVALGASLIWLITVVQRQATAWQWLQISATAVAYALALGGIARISTSIGIPKITAAAISIVLGLLWLSWPIWLSPQLSKFDSRQVVNVLVEVHPPLTANGVLASEAPWTEKLIAYRLTNLNQDVPIALPQTAWICLGFHAAIAVALWGTASVGRRNDVQVSDLHLPSGRRGEAG